MRIEVEALAPGRMQVLVSHHPQLPVDGSLVAVAIADAVLAATRPAVDDALTRLSPAGPADSPDSVGLVDAAAEPADAVPGTGPVLEQPPQTGQHDRQAAPDVADLPDGADGRPAAARSSEPLREQAMRLLDVDGLSEQQVCARLDVSVGQLRRWDGDHTPAGHAGNGHDAPAVGGASGRGRALVGGGRR